MTGDKNSIISVSCWLAGMLSTHTILLDGGGGGGCASLGAHLAKVTMVTLDTACIHTYIHGLVEVEDASSHLHWRYPWTKWHLHIHIPALRCCGTCHVIHLLMSCALLTALHCVMWSTNTMWSTPYANFPSLACTPTCLWLQRIRLYFNIMHFPLSNAFSC